MKKFVIVLTLITLSQFQIFPQDTAEPAKTFTVIVMPYDRYIQYPYSTDLIKEYLQLGLLEKGFNVVNDDSSWAIVLEKEYPLYNLSLEQAESIINDINADLIVFGFADNWNNSRSTGFYTSREMLKPILVKVYDKKKKSLVMHERINFYEYWGLNVKRLDLSDFGVQIAYRLKLIGY